MLVGLRVAARAEVDVAEVKAVERLNGQLDLHGKLNMEYHQPTAFLSEQLTTSMSAD